MRVVLADAGPLIGLARIQRLQLLRDLFTSVWITEVIAAEIGLSADECAAPSFTGQPMLQEPVTRAGFVWLSLSGLAQIPGNR